MPRLVAGELLGLGKRGKRAVLHRNFKRVLDGRVDSSVHAIDGRPELAGSHVLAITGRAANHDSLEGLSAGRVRSKPRAGHSGDDCPRRGVDNHPGLHRLSAGAIGYDDAGRPSAVIQQQLSRIAAVQELNARIEQGIVEDPLDLHGRRRNSTHGLGCLVFQTLKNDLTEEHPAHFRRLSDDEFQIAGLASD